MFIYDLKPEKRLAVWWKLQKFPAQQIHFVLSDSKHAKDANFDAHVKFWYQCWAVGQTIVYCVI